MTAPPRRPGPRSDVDVPTALLDAAEQLFGSASVDAVSLRSVARAAGVAPAALTHHFPDKTALVEAVLRRRADPVGQEVRDRLTALVEAEEDPVVRDLVEAVVHPFVAVLNAEPVAGLAWMKLFTSLGLSEEPMWLRGVGRAPSIADLYAQVLQRALPGVRGDELYRRVGIAMYSLLSALAGVDLAGYGHPISSEGLDPRFVDQLVVFTSAGLAAGQAADSGV
ncbi:TetR/AcrR family transcriptional regulator [Nocardioides dilutus]